MAQLLTLPLSRVMDANGAVYPGAKLYAYLTGTTTPTPTYTTSALSTTHTNPVVADSGGFLPPIYLDPAVTYRFVAKTTAGVAIPGMDFDPVSVMASGEISFQQAGAATVAMSVQQKAAERFSALDLLGGVLDPTDDHGALLTAALEARFATLATFQSRSPVEIWFGDSRYTYNLETPIYVQQNYIRLRSEGAILQCSGTNAIIASYDGSGNILFGVEISGFTLKGTVGDDAIIIQSGSQCEVNNIRNYATVGLAVVHFQGTISSRTSAIKSDNELGGCYNVIRETILEKTPTHYFNCIANKHEGVLAYETTSAGASFNESDSFYIAGDFEACDGPGVDVLNGRFGTIAIYAEVNGQAATGAGTDVPGDIRIRSAGGTLFSRSLSMTVAGSKCSGQLVNALTPNNVHILGGDDCLIVGNDFGGNMRIDAGSSRNTVGVQSRWIGTLTNSGSDTINMATRGKQEYYVGTSRRMLSDAYASGGALITSEANLLRLGGISSFGYNATVGNNLYATVTISGAATSGTVTFAVAEPDNSYVPIPVAIDAGTAAIPAVIIRSKTAAGFTAHLSVAPSIGQAVQLYFFILRIA
jgi:hypothetical protein